MPSDTPCLLCAVALVAFAPVAFAQRGPGAQTPPASTAETTPIPPETSSVTEHELTLDGKALRYTATAGTLLIDDDDEKPYGTIFYVGYTLAGVTDPRTRPVTFLYNGGPGSASVPLHMASVGPMRVVTASPEAAPALRPTSSFPINTACSIRATWCLSMRPAPVFRVQ